ncbi:SEC-C metal-binding domain-containing protein [Idiomarina ramblicola]|uniref:Preprotein translocase subunit SecA n=1 Tax=Idiomarina ramblicola TaxID=263724 RepID=A0A432Z169_9GAMM|nr:SEC-C metal-binding domain-containing protein [Idiomarina ramblicola]RUO71642.1 preprotein translocase subunit SecA [Idiomarina ramblicola]
MLKPVNKSPGTTNSERQLASLAQEAFFGLWSYPNIYTSEGLSKNKSGKELADVLVVFDNKVILFSDKSIKFNESKPIEVAWPRWYKTAVKKSADQLMGAYKWLKEHPNEIYLDHKCENPFPIKFTCENVDIHLVVIASNIAKSADRYWQEPTLTSFFHNFLADENNMPDTPFSLGKTTRNEKFIHVMDERGLGLLLDELSTASDFIDYLEAKEEAILSKKLLVAAAEEEILAYYLANRSSFYGYGSISDLNRQNLQDAPLLLAQGQWTEFKETLAYQELKEVRETSENWDYLISLLSKHILDATVGAASELDINIHERAARSLASENRNSRYTLARVFKEKLDSLAVNERSSRLILSPCYPNRLYLFLFVPWSHTIENYDSYRDKRRNFIGLYAQVAKTLYETVEEIVVIATEPPNPWGRSEDVIVFDTPGKVTTQDKERAQEIMKQFSILNTNKKTLHQPLSKNGRKTKKVGRNEKCPCGSGLKFKKCCLTKR